MVVCGDAFILSSSQIDPFEGQHSNAVRAKAIQTNRSPDIGFSEPARQYADRRKGYQKMPRISLIHATPVAIAPVVTAFMMEWPAADVFNLLEDSLPGDLQAAGKIDDTIISRFKRLADYAADTGADGILFTCSAFGTAIEAAATAHAPMPVLKPNEAMFEEALTLGNRIGMIATFEPSIPSMTQEFEAMVEARNATATIETVCVSDAMAALSDGDSAAHNQFVADAVDQLGDPDVLMLAQFSTAQAHPDVERRFHKPILTSPASAIRKLRGLLGDIAQ
jgi:Asp/Glu/hydantoin racemase